MMTKEEAKAISGDKVLKELISKLNKVLEDAMWNRKPICIMVGCTDIDISLIEMQTILDHLIETDPITCKQATMEVEGNNRVIFTFSDGTVRIVPVNRAGKVLMIDKYREPKKVEDLVVDAYISAKCPSCHEYVFDEDSFCKHCGQALDWDLSEKGVKNEY